MTNKKKLQVKTSPPRRDKDGNVELFLDECDHTSPSSSISSSSYSPNHSVSFADVSLADVGRGAPSINRSPPQPPMNPAFLMTIPEKGDDDESAASSTVDHPNDNTHDNTRDNECDMVKNNGLKRWWHVMGTRKNYAGSDTSSLAASSTLGILENQSVASGCEKENKGDRGLKSLTSTKKQQEVVGVERAPDKAILQDEELTVSTAVDREHNRKILDVDDALVDVDIGSPTSRGAVVGGGGPSSPMVFSGTGGDGWKTGRVSRGELYGKLRSRLCAFLMVMGFICAMAGIGIAFLVNNAQGSNDGGGSGGIGKVSKNNVGGGSSDVKPSDGGDGGSVPVPARSTGPPTSSPSVFTFIGDDGDDEGEFVYEAIKTSTSKPTKSPIVITEPPSSSYTDESTPVATNIASTTAPTDNPDTPSPTPTNTPDESTWAPTDDEDEESTRTPTSDEPDEMTTSAPTKTPVVDPTDEPTAAPTAKPLTPPTPMPTPSPTDEPPTTPPVTESPTSEVLLELERTAAINVIQSISETDVTKLDDSTPQFQAAIWLMEKDELNLKVALNPPDSRQNGRETVTPEQYAQRYSLAVIYFALNGSGWNKSKNTVEKEGSDFVVRQRKLKDVNKNKSLPQKAKPQRRILAEDDDDDESSNRPFLSNTHECNWEFIICEEAVVGLDDNGNKIRDNVVVRIVLPGADSDGANVIPGRDVRGELPGKELGKLAYLKEITMNDNKLVGSIPTELKMLQDLYWVDFTGNEMTGEIPQFGTGVQYLYLGRNNFEGELPAFEEEDDEKYELIHFWVNENNLSGEIPETMWSSLQDLSILLLDGNKLTSQLPDTMNMLTRLTWLDLASNQLSGKLPDGFYETISLQNVYLNYNMFWGEVRPMIKGLVNLEELWLDNNYFSGEIPPAFRFLDSLTSLQLHNNSFTGEVPQGLCDLRINANASLEDFTVNCNEAKHEEWVDYVECSCCEKSDCI